MRHFIIRFSVVAAGLLAVPVVANQKLNMPQDLRQNDPRLEKLRTFFRSWDSPGEQYAEEFLSAADSYDLDWRLLPSICLVESGCGKVFRKNNVFGWDSCQSGFPTVRHGIWTVASRLAKSPLYQGKPLDDVLRTYNPRKRYRRVIRRLMHSLDPASAEQSQVLD